MPITQFIANKDSESVIEYTFLDGSVYLFFIFFIFHQILKGKVILSAVVLELLFFFCFCKST